MKLFFGSIEPEIRIQEEEQQHIVKVLRMKQGEEIFVTDGKGNLVKGTLLFEGKKVILEETERFTQKENFSKRLHIAIAPTKNIDRIEFFLEKAVEMGISEVTFIQTEKSERKNINLDRLQKQAVGASKQSLRVHFPIVNDLTKLSDFIKNINPENTFVAHCHENLERTSLRTLELKKEEKSDYTFLIGPEGDFSEKEIQLLSDSGVKAVSLGEQRLRTETAGLFVAAWNYNQMI